MLGRDRLSKAEIAAAEESWHGNAGIVPFINASIVLQLLSTTFPSLKQLQREEGPQVSTFIPTLAMAASL